MTSPGRRTRVLRAWSSGTFIEWQPVRALLAFGVVLLLGAAVPVVVLFLIGAFVFYELPGITNVPSAGASGERIDVRVTGRQFYWQYDYENGATAIDTLRAPAGVPVRLQITSTDEDVIHSWWIPALGGKIDAIPGTTTETWFQAEEPGTYDGQCAELCGVEHANMLASA